MYPDDDLFISSTCFDPVTLLPINDTVQGDVATPIVSVTDASGRNESESESEVVTITYRRARLMEGDRYVCARWNASANCGGGGWHVQGCSLRTLPEGKYQCVCLHQGTFVLLDVSQKHYN